MLAYDSKAILLATFLAATQVSALGCYKGGYEFMLLRGPSNDIKGDIAADIDKTCHAVDGQTLTTAKPGYTRCSDWGVPAYNKEKCVSDCRSNCGNMPGPDTNEVFCSLGCEPSCKPGKRPTAGRINYEIRADKTTGKISYDTCKKALTTETGGKCWYGSEQVHDGFYFKIDPNEGKC